VSIVDVGVARGGTPFLVMELIRGGSIEDHRERFGNVAWALPLLAGIARGLSALHRAHIVHRDLKPANVLLEGDGQRLTAKLADFGFALVHTLEGAAGDIEVMGMTPSANAIGDAVVLTHAGAIVGTPAYMAPEAARGARLVGPPSDVFAFGLMACEMLTGRKAFEEVPVRAVLAGRVPARKTIIGGSSIPRPLASALECCLALDPPLRSSVDQVLAAFESSGIQ
jgi:serine/threonine protein kinase